MVCIFIGLAVYGTRLPGFNTNHAIPFPENMWDFTNKFGPERFSRFDDYRTQTNRHPNRQEEYIYIDGRFSVIPNYSRNEIFPGRGAEFLASLSTCRRWEAMGGKSGLLFFKTRNITNKVVHFHFLKLIWFDLIWSDLIWFD